MNLNETTADLELRCIDPVHKQHGERIQIILKGWGKWGRWVFFTW